MKTNQTFSILFWINRAKIRNGTVPIYCRVTVNGKRAEISIKRSIEPAKWDSRAGIAKGTSEASRTLNAYLDLVKGDIHRHYNRLLSAGAFITAEAIKNSYLGISEKRKTLFEVFEYHNEQMRQMVGVDVVKATFIKFETVLKKLRKFVKKRYNKSDLFLQELNHQFVTDFEYYLKVEEKIGHNTVMKYIRNLKKVMNMCVTNDWIQRNPFSNFRCANRRVEREILTQEELLILHEKEFSIQRLEEVRDIFLFCCYTGYAFVDVEKLTPDDLLTGIDGEKWIFTRRQKTKQKSNVPLLPPAIEILEKYQDHDHCRIKGKLLPVKSNQKMNAYLKEVADLCGIQKNLTMHIARHTFATTVTLANGVPIESVSSMLGHSSIKTTQIYAKVVEKKVSEDMGMLRQKFSVPIKRSSDAS